MGRISDVHNVGGCHLPLEKAKNRFLMYPDDEGNVCRLDRDSWRVLQPEAGQSRGLSVTQKLIVSIFICGSLLGCAEKEVVTSNAPEPTVQNTDPVIVDLIAKNRLEAIRSAGQSNNRKYVVYLRQGSSRERARRGSNAYEYQIALARLGEISELQEIACQFWSEDPGLAVGAFRKAADVGGQFGVEAAMQHFRLDERLDQLRNRHPAHAVGKTRRIDVYPLWEPSSSELSTSTLNHLLPSASVPLPTQSPTKDRKAANELALKWSDWIAQHRSIVTSMKPSSRDVDFSETPCRALRSIR
jgi:hypothetical protein